MSFSFLRLTHTGLHLILFCMIAAVANGSVERVDFTKPHPAKQEGQLYNVGPTGLLGYYNAGAYSDQIKIRQVEEGSPADGKLKYGDVITAVNGVAFKQGGNLIETLGNAIDEAEKAENGGKITFTVWHDANLKEREDLNKLDIKNLDVSNFIQVIDAQDSADLQRYKSEHQIEAEAAVQWKEAYRKVPIDASVRDVTLTLQVMPSYSDTSPWDCPKITKIREQAYPYLVKKMETGIGGWDKHMIPLALLASDHPEYVALVKQKMQAGGHTIRPRGRTWFAGYNILFVGEYVHRTGDKTFLPLLAELARDTASRQSIGGTWGHGSSHRIMQWTDPYGPPTPGACSGNYGAMNQAGGVCFYGMALAQKAGISDPVVDKAIERAIRFNTTWVDKGGCPYGYHYPTSRENNNGKNGAPGLAFRVLGQDDKAQYFGLSSAVEASFGYTTGHGDGTFGRFWPQLASSMAGKEAVMAWMQKVRPYYTMSRRYDGTFVSPYNGMDLGLGSLFDSTAMAVLHFSIPLAKLYMTGRELSPEVQASAKDILNLRDRIQDINIETLSDDQIMDRLDTFNVNRRRLYETELAKRQTTGRANLVPKLATLCDHKDARVREAVRHIFAQCGGKILETAMPHMLKGLKDPAEIVRIASVKGIGTYVIAGPRGAASTRIKPFLKPLLETAVTVFPDRSCDVINTTSALMPLMLNTDHAFARDPFGQGLDPDRVRQALERFLTLDPRRSVMEGYVKEWDRETCRKIAGPLLFVATKRELNGKMFAGKALAPARALLSDHKFLEVGEAGLDNAYVVPRFPRDLRDHRLIVRQVDMIISTGPPGVPKTALPWLRSLLIDYPYEFNDLIENIETHEPPAGWQSMGQAAKAQFFQDADAIRDHAQQIAYCRAELKPESKTWFRQMAAMTRLVELMGADAIPDLAPYLVTEQWRMNDHCRALITEMQAPRAAQVLVELTGHQDPAIAAAAFAMLAERGDEEGAGIGLNLLSSDDRARVRASVAKAVYRGTRGKAFKKLLVLMQRETAEEALNGYEEAFMLGLETPEKAREMAAVFRKYMSSFPVPARKHLYYLLGQIGGAENLQFLMAQVGTDSRQEFTDIVEAISLSPDRRASALMLQLLEAHKNSNRLELVSERGVRRMVLGADVIGKVPYDERLDYADRFLAIDRNIEVILCLRSIPTLRSIELILEYMKLGPAKVTEICANALDHAAGRISADLPVAERKAIAHALTQVLEYIQVVHFKGSRNVTENLLEWKELSDSVSESLRRIYNPEELIRQVINGPMVEEDIDI